MGGSSQRRVDAVVVALAAGLAQGGTTMEWQHAISKLLPALHKLRVLSNLPPVRLTNVGETPARSDALPMPVSEVEQTLVCSAHWLLRAMRTQKQAHVHLLRDLGTGYECDQGGGGQGSGRALARQLLDRETCFATGFAKWLAAAVPTLPATLLLRKA